MTNFPAHQTLGQEGKGAINQGCQWPEYGIDASEGRVYSYHQKAAQPYNNNQQAQIHTVPAYSPPALIHLVLNANKGMAMAKIIMAMTWA